MARSGTIHIENLEIDLAGYRLLRDGDPVRLTPTEWALLRELAQHPNQVLTHRVLLQRVWGEEYATESDYVHTYISRLRRKLEAEPANPAIILTEAGLGYRFNVPAPRRTPPPPTTQAIAPEDLVLHNPLQHRSRFINPLPQHIEGRYVGRDKQQRTLRDLLLDDNRLISIYGRGGIGKTALACKVLGDLQQTNTFDGMVFLSSTSTGITLGRILSDFNRLLGGDGFGTAEGQAIRYRITQLLDRLRNGRYLLLLDNLEELQHPETNEFEDTEIADFFRVVLEQGSTLRLLVTSRYPLKLPRSLKIWERVVSLEDGLNTGEGIALLRTTDPDGQAGLRDASDERLARLTQRLHGLPRALETVVGLLLESPLLTVDDLLDDDSLLSDELGDMFIQGAINNLSADAVQVMTLVALFERAVPMRVFNRFASPVMDKPLKPLLNRLIRAYFLSYNNDNQTISMHPIDRDYCYRLINADERHQFHRQIAALYEDEFTPELPQVGQAELNDLRRAFYHWRAGRAYEQAAALLLRMDHEYLAMWGSFGELADGYRTLSDALREGELGRKVRLRYAEAVRRLGQLSEAIQEFEKLHQQAVIDNDRQTEADALSGLGWSHYDMARFSDAIHYWEAALGHYQALGNRYGEGDLLSGMGWVSYLMGSYDQALAHIQDSFRIFGELGNQLYRIGINIGDSGVIRAAQGDVEQAIQNLRESLAIADRINAVSEKSYKGRYLATALLLADQTAEAETAAREAIQYDVPANRHAVYAVHGIALARQKEIGGAVTAFEQAIDHADALLQSTADLYTAHYTQALALAGLSLLRGEDRLKAINSYMKARTLCSTAGVLQAQRQLLGALIPSDERGDYERLFRLLQD